MSLFRNGEMAWMDGWMESPHKHASTLREDLPVLQATYNGSAVQRIRPTSSSFSSPASSSCPVPLLSPPSGSGSFRPSRARHATVCSCALAGCHAPCLSAAKAPVSIVMSVWRGINNVIIYYFQVSSSWQVWRFHGARSGQVRLQAWSVARPSTGKGSSSTASAQV